VAVGAADECRDPDAWLQPTAAETEHFAGSVVASFASSVEFAASSEPIC